MDEYRSAPGDFVPQRGTWRGYGHPPIFAVEFHIDTISHIFCFYDDSLRYIHLMSCAEKHTRSRYFGGGAFGKP